MTKELVLKVQTRTEKNLNDLRTSGFTPGVLYGGKDGSQSIQVNKIELEKAYTEVGESSLFDIDLGGKKKKVIIKEFQMNPVRDEVVHFDLFEVDLTKKIEVELPLNFVGESIAVKNKGGVLSLNIEKVKVSCLPDDLLDSLDVDLAKLADFSDSIRVEDLNLPESFDIISNKSELVANVLEPKKMAAAAAAQDEADAKADADAAAAKGGTEEKKEEEATSEEGKEVKEEEAPKTE